MQYRVLGKTGEKVSVLGFGCMRLPVKDENGKQVVDEDEAVRIVRTAIDQGVNYIDTAYGYHGGESERIVGKILADGYREKVLLATKSPMWHIKTALDFDRILDEQLAKLNTDHIDFYLMHALDGKTWDNTVIPLGICEKIKAAKACGKIRHIGFSFHDNAEAFIKILNGFDEWEFCQIQMNYIDVNNQATIKGLEAAAEKGLGVIIMEPLLGGKLADPPVQVSKVLDEAGSNTSTTPVEWALNFLWDRKDISLLLSGMSNMEQVQDNLRIADSSVVGMLSPEDHVTLEKARFTYLNMALVPCTKCAYCMPCPCGLDIPKIYQAYNTSAALNLENATQQYNSIPITAEMCSGCGACTKICPQHIDSGSLMPKIAETFSGTQNNKV